MAAQSRLESGDDHEGKVVAPFGLTIDRSRAVIDQPNPPPRLGC